MSAAKRIRLKQARGSAIASILNPVNGYRGMLERKGIKPKNHHLDNIRALRQRQSMNRMSKAVQAEAAKRKKFKMKKFQNVQSTVARKIGRSPKAGGHKFLKKGALEGRQKVAEKPYVSQKVRSRPAVPSVSDRPASVRSAREPTPDYVKMNRTQAAATRARAPKPQTPKVNENFGKIPDYLMRRKIELAKKQERQRLAQTSSTAPPGMTMLSEEERQDTLSALRRSRQQVEDDLARFPLIVETISRRRAKKALESKLKEIENAIKVFSQARVFLED